MQAASKPERAACRACLWPFAAAALLAPATARAHLVTTGLGPVYDGMGHFIISVDDWLPALALALLAGQNGPAAGRVALWALPLAWMAGGAAGLFAGLPPPSPALGAGILAATFLAAGGLVGAECKLPPWAVGALAVAMGLVHGLFNGQEMLRAGASPGAGVLAFAGIGILLFVLVALGAGGVVALRPAWARIAVRVAGSWVAAAGILWLGWSLRGQA